MARVVSKSKSTLKSGSAAKRPTGRPAGSRNKVKAAAAPAPKQTAVKKAVSPTSKLSKAELEAQVVKLERSLARSRKQVAELKLLASGSSTRGEQAVSAPKASPPVTKKATPAARKAPKQKPVAARGGRKKSHPVEPALDEVTDEAETEAHAS